MFGMGMKLSSVVISRRRNTFPPVDDALQPQATGVANSQASVPSQQEMPPPSNRKRSLVPMDASQMQSRKRSLIKADMEFPQQPMRKRSHVQQESHPMTTRKRSQIQVNHPSADMHGVRLFNNIK
uniref:Uncharacterized protein n=1 Tax=Plectus sambesii TaxID=2011161 RepID=A0A914WZS2_9BILA